MRWNTVLTQSPYFTESLSDFSGEALAFILQFTPSDAVEHKKFLRMKVYMCLTVYAMMRNADVYDIFCDGISMVAASAESPRCIRFVLRSTKNDPQGTGPISGRTYHIPCFCSNQMSGKSKGSFIRTCVADTGGLKAPCDIDTCPYRFVQEYLKLIQFPFGNPESGELRFLRALSNGSNPRYLSSNYGENTMRDIPKMWNNLLPDDLKVSRPTGHSGRTTGVP